MNLPIKKSSVNSSLTGKERWRRRMPYLLSFFIPVLSMILIFIGKQIYPFGDRSFLRTDLYHQYAPFFQEMKDKLSNGESLFYTWDIGLGTNFMAIFAYYLSSPMNWFLLLCPSEYVIEFITYGIVLKMALSSLTMTWYLNRRSNTNSLGAAFFGIFYGMSGYMAAYSWNIMWLDCMILLPVIFRGLERLVKDDKCFLYSISLGLAILSNYYISIMICISLVIYFVVQMILLEGKNINYPKKILTFSLFSLLAGGLAGVVLLPEISALAYTASGSINFPTSWSSYFTMYDMMARHLINVEVEIGLDHWPNIYCGIGILLFVPLYFMNQKISFREKMAYLVMLIFFYFSFSTNKLNFIWHGFHYPNSLPARQSFIYIFLVLSMGFKGFMGIRERSRRQVTGVVVGAVLFVILAEKLEEAYTGSGDDMYYMWYSFYLSILFLLIYGAALYQYRIRPKKWRVPLAILMFTAITIEATINMSYTSVTTVGRTTYKEYDENVRILTSQAAEAEDTVFYRVEKVRNRTKNDGAWLDYPSASIFSSTAYAHLTAFYKKIGLESSTNAYGTTGSTPASNMLLGIRYSLYTDNDPTPEDNELRSLYLSTDNVDLYKNTYALSLGFLVSDTLASDWDVSADDPGINWNNLVHSLGIKGDLFTPLDILNNGTTNVTVDTAEGGYYCFYSSKAGPSELRISYNGTSKTFDSLSRSYFMAIDYQPEAVTFTIANSDSTSSSIINLSAYRLNEDVLEELYRILNDSPMEVTSYTSTTVDATVNASCDGTLVTTIPYDKGWTVLVDGNSVDMTAWKDTFVSFPVSQGTHTIELSYTPDGFYMGLAMTLICIILLIMIWLLIWLWKKNQAEALAQESENTEDTPADDEVSSTTVKAIGSIQPQISEPEETVESDAFEQEAEDWESDRKAEDTHIKNMHYQAPKQKPGLDELQKDILLSRHNSLKRKEKAAGKQSAEKED